MAFKASVTAFWMSSVASNWYLFTADFTFWNKKEVSSCEIRWLRRLRHRRNAFGCQKLRSTAHPAVALWDSQGDTLAQIFVLNPNSSVSTKRTVFRLIFTLSAIILTVNLRSDGANSLTHAVLSPVSVFDCRPLHCSSSKTVLPSGVPRNFVRGGGSAISVEDRGQRERGSVGDSPLVRGSGGSCNLVQEISFHTVKCS